MLLFLVHHTSTPSDIGLYAATYCHPRFNSATSSPFSFKMPKDKASKSTLPPSPMHSFGGYPLFHHDPHAKSSRTADLRMQSQPRAFHLANKRVLDAYADYVRLSMRKNGHNRCILRRLLGARCRFPSFTARAGS